MTRPGRNLIVTILGRKGSGKTFLSKKILAEYPCVVAIDTVAQYHPEDGFEVVTGKNRGAVALQHVYTAHARGRIDGFKIALRADDTDELMELIGVVYEMPGVLVVIDEASFYCSPSKLPPNVSRLVRLGRHRNISQVYIAQRPSEVHRSITAQSDIVVSFVQREERDVKYLIENGGGIDAEHVSELPRYKLIAFGDGMEGEDVPLAIIEQRVTFGSRHGRQLDMLEEDA